MEERQLQYSGLVDLTGLISKDMWSYPAPYTAVEIRPLEHIDWANAEVYAEAIEGLNSQSGTYLETNAHYYGPNNPRTRSIDQIPLEEIFEMDAVCLDLRAPVEAERRRGQRRPRITREMLSTASEGLEIREGEALLLATGWGTHWASADYLSDAPSLSLPAMHWLLERRPSLIGSDSPRWENDAGDEGIFPPFFEADILMLAPLVNLEKLPAARGKLTVLPLHVKGTSAAPSRAVFYLRR